MQFKTSQNELDKSYVTKYRKIVSVINRSFPSMIEYVKNIKRE